jgi:hypothetical protein
MSNLIKPAREVESKKRRIRFKMTICSNAIRFSWKVDKDVVPDS